MYSFYIFVLLLPTLILSAIKRDQTKVKAAQTALRLVGIQQRKTHEKHMKGFFHEVDRLPFQFPSSDRESVEDYLTTLPRWHPVYEITRHFKAITEQRFNLRKKADDALGVNHLISKSIRGAVKAMPPVPPHKAHWTWIIKHTTTGRDKSSSKSSSWDSVRSESSTNSRPRYPNHKEGTPNQAMQQQGSPPKRGPSSGLRRRTLKDDKAVGDKGLSSPAQSTRSKTRSKHLDTIRQGLRAVAANEGEAFIRHKNNSHEQFSCWLKMATSGDRNVRCNWDERAKRANKGFKSLSAAGKHMETQNLIAQAVPGLKAIRPIDWRLRRYAIKSLIRKGIQKVNIQGAKAKGKSSNRVFRESNV
ncbi:hypothetical protein MMC10_008761 [Thelotrema lepadinum]|nr:hypothetical protein [Thelotrema lepadinum]